MKLMLSAALAVALHSSPSLAGGTHPGGHGHDKAQSAHGHDTSSDHHKLAIGKPGKAADVTRTINVSMRELPDGSMVFEPSTLHFRRGETIRFAVSNDGELEHEFVLDDHHGIEEHKALMEKFPEMEHDDPNSIRLEPGQEGEILWSFTNDGEFAFACLIPGHHQAGMNGKLEVTDAHASN